MSEIETPTGEALKAARQWFYYGFTEAMPHKAAIMAALDLARDVWNPTGPDVLADNFWQSDSEYGHGSVAELLDDAAEDYDPGDMATVEICRVMALPTFYASFMVGANGLPVDPTYHREYCAASSASAQRQLALDYDPDTTPTPE